MAIKKPLFKKATRQVEEEEAPAPKKLLKKKAPVEEEEEDQEQPDPDEEQEEEAPAPKKLLKKKAPVEETEEEEEEEEEAPVRKGSSLKKKAKKESRSLADVFDSTKPGRGILPAGDYKAYVAGFEMEGDIADEGEAQGELKIKVTYEIHEDDEDAAGKTISQWYQIADDDGEPGPGIPYLKGDLDVLGYEDIKLEDLEEIFADVEAERQVVVIKVKQNGQYTNAYLQGLAETE